MIDYNYYDAGNLVTLTATFTDLSEEPKDPTEVTLKIKKPDDTVLIVTSLTHVSTGVYSYDFLTAIPGIHFYQFEATGAVKATKKDIFCVNQITV